jgi:hypothetical protein
LFSQLPVPLLASVAFLKADNLPLPKYSKRVLLKKYFWTSSRFVALFWNVYVFYGVRNTFSTPSFTLFASTHARKKSTSLHKHPSAVRSWHLERSSLFRFSSGPLFLQKFYTIKTTFLNDVTVTTGMSATICPRLTKRRPLFKHFQPETIYKITDVCIMTDLLKALSYGARKPRCLINTFKQTRGQQ